MALAKLTDTAGRDVSYQSKPTYYGTMAEFTPPATPTDMISLKGSATKTIRVISFEFFTAATAASVVEFFLIKRTTANTVGTFVADQIAQADSNDAAPSGVFGHYTANPTVTAANAIHREKVVQPAVPARYEGDLLRYATFSLLDRPITLRGIAQELHLNLNGVALPAGMVIAANVVWIEE